MAMTDRLKENKIKNTRRVNKNERFVKIIHSEHFLVLNC